jgi:hypothetical protein
MDYAYCRRMGISDRDSRRRGESRQESFGCSRVFRGTLYGKPRVDRRQRPAEDDPKQDQTIGQQAGA